MLGSLGDARFCGFYFILCFSFLASLSLSQLHEIVHRMASHPLPTPYSEKRERNMSTNPGVLSFLRCLEKYCFHHKDIVSGSRNKHFRERGV